jgi:hypothetical protein
LRRQPQPPPASDASYAGPRALRAVGAGEHRKRLPGAPFFYQPSRAFRHKKEEQEKEMALLNKAAEWVQAHWRGVVARRDADKQRKGRKKGKGKGKKK